MYGKYVLLLFHGDLLLLYLWRRLLLPLTRAKATVN